MCIGRKFRISVVYTMVPTSKHRFSMPMHSSILPYIVLHTYSIHSCCRRLQCAIKIEPQTPMNTVCFNYCFKSCLISLTFWENNINNLNRSYRVPTVYSIRFSSIYSYSYLCNEDEHWEDESNAWMYEV